MKLCEQHAMLEIALGIGHGLDLVPMLEHSVLLLLRKLGCAEALVGRHREAGWETVLSIPRHDAQAAWTQLSESQRETLYRQDHATQWPVADGQAYAYPLPDFGLLILVRHGTPLPERIIQSLLPILTNQLAAAAIACEQKAALGQERRRQEYLAFHDGLTGLANRAFFEQSVQTAMARAERARRHLAIGILDLDGFKEWNDTLGHKSGDVLLQEIARQLRGVVRSEEWVSRLGGDEFGLCVTVDHSGDLALLSQRILQSVASVHSQDRSVSGSLGWAMHPQDGAHYDTLLTHADEAMYAAKAAGKNTFRLFHGPVAQAVRNREWVQRGFVDAIAQGTVHFLLQPQADLRSHRITGAEMLVRWGDGERSLSPAEFILDLERDVALMRALGRHALASAVALRDDLRRRRLELPLSVNIGAAHFLHPGLFDDVETALDGHSAQGLTIEITESAALDNLDQAVRTIDLLHARGLLVSLDDFGTGYSSLRHAAELPVDEFKLDYQFTRRWRESPQAFAVACSALLLGDLSSAHVIAEGVGTQEDLALWMRMGGQYIQGYLLAPPMTPDAFLTLLQEDFPLPTVPAPVYPMEDLIFLGYCFRPTSSLFTLKKSPPQQRCSLTQWFTDRGPLYGHLPGFQEAFVAHQTLRQWAENLWSDDPALTGPVVRDFQAAIQHLRQGMETRMLSSDCLLGGRG